MNEAIDSLKLRIPLRKVKLLDEGLIHRWVEVDEETGEVDTATFKSKALRIHEYGITTRYAFNPLGKGEGRKGMLEDEIIIGLNAKLLGKLNDKGASYFKAITFDTLPILHKLILDQGVISLTYDDFLEARASDIDFKTDWVLTSRLAQDTFVKELDKKTKPNKSSKRGSSATYTETKLICDWGTRATASESSPYCKTYSKPLELSYKSSEFKKAYGIDCPDFLQRIEVTMKNKAMFERIWGSKLGQPLTLAYVLSKSKEDILKIIHVSLSKHFENYETTERETNKNLSMTEVTLMALLDFHESQTLAVDHLKKYASTKQQVTKLKKQVSTVWTLKYEGTNKGKISNEVDSLFSHLGF